MQGQAADKPASTAAGPGSRMGAAARFTYDGVKGAGASLRDFLAEARSPLTPSRRLSAPKAAGEPTASAKTVSSPVGERGGDKEAVGNAWRSRSPGMPARGLSTTTAAGRARPRPRRAPTRSATRYQGALPRPARPSPSRTAPGGTRTIRCRRGLADGRTPPPDRASPPIRAGLDRRDRFATSQTTRRCAPGSLGPCSSPAPPFSRDTQKMPPGVGTRMPRRLVS